jgi:uncharacterized protein YjdB
MVRNNTIAGKAIAAAVCVAMIFSVVFAFPPLQASAAVGSIRTIAVDGIGDVYYATVASTDIDGGYDGNDNEWYHTHINYSGTKDFRQMSDGTMVVYYVVDHSELPEISSAGKPVEADDDDGLGFDLYGLSQMSFYDFWKNEGLTPSTVTDRTSSVLDPEGYTDLGGFDTVVRSTLTFGLGHTSYAYDNIVNGYPAVVSTDPDDAFLTSGQPFSWGNDSSGAAIYARDSGGDPIYDYNYDEDYNGPVSSFSPTFRVTNFAGGGYESVGKPWLIEGPQTSSSGHASTKVFYATTGALSNADQSLADDKNVYIVENYNVAGFRNMPVSVGAMDYVEMMIMKDMNASVPKGFTNLRVGEGLYNIWDGNYTTSIVTGTDRQGNETTSAAYNAPTAATIAVDEETGLLKHLNRNGEYGKANDAKNEMNYDLKSNGGWESVGSGYDSQWGDYYDAFIYIQDENSAVSNKCDLIAPQYSNYAYNFIGARYDYYGSLADLGLSSKDGVTLESLASKPVKASYGTSHAADSWWRPASNNPRFELGFNFDSLRLGGNGQDTKKNGIFQGGSAANKIGFYKITMYALGHDKIEKLVYVPPRSYSLPATTSINKGSDSTLTVDVQTLSASTAPPTISWTTSDENIAAVDETGKVTAVAAGTATITASTSSGSGTNGRLYTATCKVTVVDPSSGGTPGGETPGGETPGGNTPGGETPGGNTPGGETPSVNPPAVNPPAVNTPSGDTPTSDNAVVAASIKLNVSKATLYHKGSKSKTTLKATVTGASNAVTWKSSNAKVATVSSTGVITAKAKGTATITATANGINATTVVTVKNAALTLKKANATIKNGKKYTIKATATPAAKATYKSSNKKVATVSSKGVVKAKKKGKATITVTANGISKKFKVTIK